MRPRVHTLVKISSKFLRCLMPFEASFLSKGRFGSTIVMYCIADLVMLIFNYCISVLINGLRFQRTLQAEVGTCWYVLLICAHTWNQVVIVIALWPRIMNNSLAQLIELRQFAHIMNN